MATRRSGGAVAIIIEFVPLPRRAARAGFSVSLRGLRRFGYRI
jgi:hypothetical protein